MSEQLRPVPNTGARIVDLVKADLDARAEKGLETYGTYLQAFNGRDPAQDAYEEALDQAKFLKQLCIERKAMESRIAELEQQVESQRRLVGQYIDGMLDSREKIAALERERDEWRSKALDSDSDSIDRINELAAERDEALAALGPITPCPNCDGKGEDERGSACCRIAGHAKECDCLICQWMRSSYANENAANEARAQAAEYAALKKEYGAEGEPFGSLREAIEHWKSESATYFEAAGKFRAQAARLRDALVGVRDHPCCNVCSVETSFGQMIRDVLAETPAASLEAIRAEIEERMDAVSEAVHAQQLHEIAADPSRLESMNMDPNSAPAALRKLRDDAAAQALEEAALVADPGMANFLRDKAAFIRNGAKA